MSQKIYEDILSLLPNSFVKYSNINQFEEAEEIRVRLGKQFLIRSSKKEVFLNYIVTSEDILRMLERFTQNSIYSFQNEINVGYITLKGRS